MSLKIYVKFAAPPADIELDAEVPVENVWVGGDRPDPKMADGKTLTVFDELAGGRLVNERIWDGVE